MQSSSTYSDIVISLKKQIRIITIFQVIIPSFGLIWILVTQTNIFLRNPDTLQKETEPVVEFSRLSETILICSYCMFLLAKIGTALLLCQGVAKRDSCKLTAWVILETLSTFLGISFCILILFLDFQECSLSHIWLVSSMTSIVSAYAIIITLVYLRRNKFELSTRDYDECVSLRFEPRKSASCNFSKSTQTLN